MIYVYLYLRPFSPRSVPSQPIYWTPAPLLEP